MEKRAINNRPVVPAAIASLPRSYLNLMAELPLVEQAGMTVKELGELLGSKGAASELVSGKRKEPSKAQIAKCARFKVDAGAFLLPAGAPADAA